MGVTAIGDQQAVDLRKGNAVGDVSVRSAADRQQNGFDKGYIVSGLRMDNPLNRQIMELSQCRTFS